MLSSELSVNDMDCMSFCDNSMYVLPPKTELNSSFYIEDSDLINIYRKNSKNYFSQRKISSNVDIPTYKGFSVANGYSTNIKKTAYVLPNQHYANYEKGNISRKVHLSTGVSNMNDEFVLIKNRLSVKHKLKTGDQKINVKREKHPEKSLKRTETFLGDTNPARRHNPGKAVLKDDNKTSAGRQKSEGNDQIKSYMDHKRSHSKKLMQENKQSEKEKKKIIKERLKLLSQQIRSQEHKPRPVAKTVKQSREKASETEDDISQSDNSHKRCADNSVNECDQFCRSIKLQLAQWAPLDDEALDQHRLDSQNYMRNAVHANRQADSILANIIQISDKMRLTKQELIKFSSGNRAANYSNDEYKPPKHQSETSSMSSSTSNYFEVEDDGYYPPAPKKYFPKPTHENVIKKDVASSIFASRARRKLDIDDKDAPDIYDSDSTASAYDGIVARLTEENQTRYEQSIERNQPIVLPLHKSVSKSTKDEDKNIIKKQDIHNLERDSLTFMKTYRRCKNGKTIDFRRRIETDTNNSRASYESTNVVSGSHKSNHQSMRLLNNGSRTKDNNLSQESINGNQYTMDSEITKSASVDASNTLESFRESYAFSEVEVTIENSTSIEHFSIQPSKTYKMPPRPIYHGSTEPRLSPDSLERQLMIELHYHDGLQASMEQLLQADRFQGVGFAQQETVSLAQILKGRQWKDARDNETNENLERFTAALNNLNNNRFSKRHRSPSSSSVTSSSTITSSHSRHLNNRKGISTTESEASEIEEEIVEFPESSESQHSNQINNHRRDRSTPRPIKNNVKSKSRPKLVVKPKPVHNDHSKSIDSIVEIDIPHSNIEESAQEISTAISGSKTSSSQKSSKDTSITESIESQSLTTRSTTNNPIKESKRPGNTEEFSTTKSVKTDSSYNQSEKSPTEISTSRSFENEKKSTMDSNTSGPDTNSKSQSKSTLSTSPTENSIAKSDVNITNYSRDEFEANSDYQKSTSESEIINRVCILETEKKKKQKLVEKLQHKLSIVKHRRKEKSLKNYINHLDSQIEVLQDELLNPNLNSSSISLSPIAKPKKSKSSKEMKILPTYNRKQTSSSSSTSISKDDDVKSVSIASSLSSSTLVSDTAKDKSFNGNDQTENKKVEDVETPRSVKQIQFEDINEEYSASNQDSSELKTPSEKSRLSKEITDNGVAKSKSENFHILVIDKPQQEDEEENDEMKVISARTIHSEISEIPMEGEFSDQEIDDFSDKIDELEKNKTHSYRDMYSEDFSEVTSHKNSSTGNVIQHESGEISHREDILSLDSSKSSSSPDPSAPEIPPRRKFTKHQPPMEDESAATYENTVDIMGKIGNICDHLFNTIFDEIVAEDIRRRKVPRLIGLENIGDDDYSVGNGVIAVSGGCYEGPIGNDSIDSLNDQLSDGKYESLGSLIPWTDEEVLPLVDLAIEQLFHARQQRQGKTADAFALCRDNMPARFSDINNESEITRIYNQWSVYRARGDKSVGDVRQKLFISRVAIYSVVLEIVSNIYELDDAPQPTPWMTYEYDSARKKKLILWAGNAAPNSLDVLSTIVRKQLAAINVISVADHLRPPGSAFTRSRQHQWFLNKTDDPVDRLLIDETFQDDPNWQNYNRAIERTIYMITDEILANEIQEILSSVAIINGERDLFMAV